MNHDPRQIIKWNNYFILYKIVSYLPNDVPRETKFSGRPRPYARVTEIKNKIFIIQVNKFIQSTYFIQCVIFENAINYVYG